MQNRRDAETARITEREAYNRRQYKKAKVDWYSFGGTPRCGCRVITKKYDIPYVHVWRLPRCKDQEGLDHPSDDDDNSGDYDFDRTF